MVRMVRAGKVRVEKKGKRAKLIVFNLQLFDRFFTLGKLLIKSMNTNDHTTKNRKDTLLSPLELTKTILVGRLVPADWPNFSLEGMKIYGIPK